MGLLDKILGRKETKGEKLKRILGDMNIDVGQNLISEIENDEDRLKSFLMGLLLGLGAGAFLGLWLGVSALKGRR